MPKIISSIKCFGGGFFKAPKIAKLIDWKPTYVECFLGGGNLLLNSPDFTTDGKKITKYALDVNGPLIATWMTIRDDVLNLQQILKNVVYSQKNFEDAKQFINELPKDSGKYDGFYDNADLTIAVSFLCMNRMSRGANNTSYGWSDRLRRSMPEYLSAFASMIDNLPAVSRKIQGVTFIHGCAGKDFPSVSGEVCVYADPPFVKESRVSKKAYGLYELDTYSSAKRFSHEDLLELAMESTYTWYISGYHNELYDRIIGDKVLSETKMSNSASQQKVKPLRNEILWCLNKVNNEL